jgi:hypothetical protein
VSDQVCIENAFVKCNPQFKSPTIAAYDHLAQKNWTAKLFDRLTSLSSKEVALPGALLFFYTGTEERCNFHG